MKNGRILDLPELKSGTTLVTCKASLAAAAAAIMIIFIINNIKKLKLQINRKKTT